MLKIINLDIIDGTGNILKTLSCPKKVSDMDLVDAHAPVCLCKHCDHEIVNAHNINREVYLRIQQA